MRIFYNLNKVKKYHRPVVVLGVFDGVHLGHRKILQAAVRQAKAINGTSILVTFWPHPQAQKSLYSLEHRLNLIERMGIDLALVIKFDRSFSQISAENFVKNILVGKLGAAHIFIGRNFRFGRYASGDAGLLEKLSSRYNFKLKTFAVMKIKQQAISSTYIRCLISRGDLKDAEKLLLRPVSILGTVIHGTSLARKLGFPTANINPHHEILPPSGVYAVKVIYQKRKFNGICYIGPKPTFIKEGMKGGRQKDTHIEVHIFKFRRNIYGKNLEVQFLKKIRPARKFAKVENLANQVKKDIQKAQRLFSSPKVYHKL